MADVWVPGWTIKRFTDPKSFLANANEVACAHTQVGGWPGSWNWGNQDGNPYAQSYLKCDGEGVNAWPVNLRGAANLEGNHRVWAIETEDVDADCFAPWNLTCGNVPAWTDPQVETLIEGFTWWCIRFRRPAVIIPDARPGRVGLGYHRFGVPNSPEWVTGAERWTRSEGKCCPDWRRIAQFRNEIVPEVARRVAGIQPPEEEMTEADWLKLSKIVRDQVVDVVLRSAESTAQFRDLPWEHNIPTLDHPAETVLKDARIIARRAEEAALAAQATAQKAVDLLEAAAPEA